MKYYPLVFECVFSLLLTFTSFLNFYCSLTESPGMSQIPPIPTTIILLQAHLKHWPHPNPCLTRGQASVSGVTNILQSRKLYTFYC